MKPVKSQSTYIILPLKAFVKTKNLIVHHAW